MVPLTRDSLLKESKVLYTKSYVQKLELEFKRAEEADQRADNDEQRYTQQILDRYEARRGCLSTFMQAVKERIAHHINKSHKRKGTLWDGRFKSPLVQNTLEALLAVSTYIDLNPIRAGIVKKPEDYRWCGYSAALGGDSMARKGIAKIYSYRGGSTKKSSSKKWKKIQSDYRQALYERGLEVLADPESGMTGRLGFTAEQVAKEIKRNGKLSSCEVLLYRVRYFTDGAIIGSASFIDEIFGKHNERLTARTTGRKTGARQMRSADWGGLYSFHDLQTNAIGHPN